MVIITFKQIVDGIFLSPFHNFSGDKYMLFIFFLELFHFRMLNIHW